MSRVFFLKDRFKITGLDRRGKQKRMQGGGRNTQVLAERGMKEGSECEEHCENPG